MLLYERFCSTQALLAEENQTDWGYAARVGLACLQRNG
jgi:hypothetical protein